MGHSIKYAILLVAATLWSNAFANEISQWLVSQKQVSGLRLLENISPEGAARGAVVASPSKDNPNYFRHWIRDAGLTMDVVIGMYQRATNADEKAQLRTRLVDYVTFSRTNQVTPNPSGGLGEPLFNADGSPFNQGWGRPQNDSPAIRAYTLVRLANILLQEGQAGYVREWLYDGKIPTSSVIKADLEYVAHHLDDTSFDLWEEVRGFHFYTRMVQRRALVDGAKLAETLGDGGAANFYRAKARELEGKIDSHWHWSDKLIMTTLGRDGGIDYKNSHLDASTILAVLHGATGDGFFPPSDDRILATAAKINERFKAIYPINNRGAGVAIGRYPEDRYDGYSTGGEGNPWILLTNGFGELYHRMASDFESRGYISFNEVNRPFFQALLHRSLPDARLSRGDATLKEILRALRAEGDAYLARTRTHTASDGSMAEQLNRHTGFMQGARDLTWSYASLLSAAWARR